VIFHSYMSTEPTTARRSVRMVAILAVGLALACNTSEAAPPAPGTTAEPAEPAQAAPPKPKVEAENYIAAIALVGDCKAGKECTAEVSLEAKGVYKLNDQYPFKFVAKEGQGVTFPKPKLTKADGKWDDKKKGSFRVPFVVDKKGKADVAGVLSLSVCSEANCIMDKAALVVNVDAT
jgi:hypothetical protein